MSAIVTTSVLASRSLRQRIEGIASGIGSLPR